MPKNQLFKNTPDLQIVQSVLEAFGLENIRRYEIIYKRTYTRCRNGSENNRINSFIKRILYPL